MNILIVLHRVEEAACVFVVVQDELTVLHELFGVLPECVMLLP